MTCRITNNSKQLQSITMTHSVVCIKTGICTCENNFPRTIHLAPGTHADLPNEVIDCSGTRKKVAMGILTVYSQPVIVDKARPGKRAKK